MSKKQKQKEEEGILDETPDKVEGQEEPAASGAGLPVEEELVDEETNFVRELGEQKEKFIRLLAEFENYKRRTARERMDIIRTASQDLVLDLLPVLDDLDRADEMIGKAQDADATQEGLRLISDKLRKVMDSKGLTVMDVMGQAFDAETMEAITEIDAGKKARGKVVDVIEKGYQLNEKIIRYAKVVVGR